MQTTISSSLSKQYTINVTPLSLQCTDLASMSNGTSPLPVIVHHAVMLTGWLCLRPYRHSHCPSPGYHTRTSGSVAVVANIWPVGSQWIDVIVCCSEKNAAIIVNVSKMHPTTITVTAQSMILQIITTNASTDCTSHDGKIHTCHSTSQNELMKF